MHSKQLSKRPSEIPPALEPLVQLVHVNAGVRDHPAESMWLFAGHRKKNHVAVWLRVALVADGACGAELTVEGKRCQILSSNNDDGGIVNAQLTTSWQLAADMAVPTGSSWTLRLISYRLLELDELTEVGLHERDVMRYSRDMFDYGRGPAPSRVEPSAEHGRPWVGHDRSWLTMGDHRLTMVAHGRPCVDRPWSAMADHGRP